MNLLASLRYLAALDEHKHFGRAAAACHITQPALSNALRALEKEFGTAIVKRGRSFGGWLFCRSDGQLPAGLHHAGFDRLCRVGAVFVGQAATTAKGRLSPTLFKSVTNPPKPMD